MPGLLEEEDTSRNDAKKSPFPHAIAGTTTLPSGVVLDKDGKPCRTCTSSAAWKSMMKSSSFTKQPAAQKNTPVQTEAQSRTDNTTTSSTLSECPPDVDELGRNTWTLLHTMTASYPPAPPPAHQSKVASFLKLFSQLYPCWVCAEDFQSWMAEPENDPLKSGALGSQEGFGRWMCQAHNVVNKKLGKEEFNCNLWKERWKDGWKDGRCD